MDGNALILVENNSPRKRAGKDRRTAMNISKWDTEGYATHFDFVPGYGQDTLKLVDVPEGSLVVDLGSGTGALTEKLKDMGYEVLGIDSSPDMIVSARQLHPDLSFELADGVTFRLEKQADAIFSSSVIHWIDRDRQQALAQNIYDNLKPGGIFVCEFGGKDCCEIVRGTLARIFAERGLVYPRFFYFPTIGEYTPLLESVGFRVEYAVFFDRPTQLKGDDTVSDWIRMFEKNAFEGIGEELKEDIIREAEERTKPLLFHEDADGNGWFIDYVRIKVKARKV